MTDKLNVLLVDDEKIVGNRLKPALAKVGCEVEVFVDPQKALQRIDEKVFDIIVTDIMMEGVNGIQILEAAMAKSKRTKVIVISGYANVTLAREAMDKGAFDIIDKPFRPDDLRGVIAAATEALGFKGKIDANNEP
jgi:DNA-binding NtrC family response regulator